MSFSYNGKHYSVLTDELGNVYTIVRVNGIEFVIDGYPYEDVLDKIWED